MVSITFFWRINCKTSTKKMKRRENMLHVVLQVAAFMSYVFFDCFQSGWARLPHAAPHSVLSQTPEVDEKKEWKNERMNRLYQQVSQESRCSDCKRWTWDSKEKEINTTELADVVVWQSSHLISHTSSPAPKSEQQHSLDWHGFVQAWPEENHARTKVTPL